MNFTVTARGDGCNVAEKRASLQLDDKKVFSAVVEIVNNEIIMNKVVLSLYQFLHIAQLVSDTVQACSQLFSSVAKVLGLMGLSVTEAFQEQWKH